MVACGFYARGKIGLLLDYLNKSSPELIRQNLFVYFYPPCLPPHWFLLVLGGKTQSKKHPRKLFVIDTHILVLDINDTVPVIAYQITNTAQDSI